MKMKPIQMKQIILSIIFIAGIASLSTAQNVRFNAYTAYVFDDNVDSYYDDFNYYKGRINGGFQWGGGLEFMVDQTKGVELKYLRRDAIAPMEYYKDGAVRNKQFELAMNYILLGGSNYFKTGGKVEPYAGAAIGMNILTIKNADVSDNTVTKFAWGLKLGTNIWATDKVGLKLQADLLSVVQSAGGSFYFGTGGSGAGISAYSTVYQWVLGGGLTFKLGQ